MAINDGEPAFPVSTRPVESGNGYGHQDGHTTWQFSGMTLRQYYAAKAMQARLTRQPDPLPAPQWFQPGHELEDAKACFVIADAMIAAERSKPND